MAYSQYATFRGYGLPIRSLSFSVNAKFLAWTGFDGIRVWDLGRSSPLSIPRAYAEPRYGSKVFCASVWIYFEGIRRHVLLLGGHQGKVTSWAIHDSNQGIAHLGHSLRPPGDAPQITSLEVYEPSIKPLSLAFIAAGCADGSHSTVSILALSASGPFTTIFRASLGADFVPEFLRFNKGRDLYAFSRSGKMALLRNGPSYSILWIRQISVDRIGSLVVDEPGNRLVIHTGAEIQILALSELALKQTIPCNVHFTLVNRMYPQLATLDDRKHVVTGTHSTHAVIYSLENGTTNHVVSYAGRGSTPIVAAASNAQNDYIAVAFKPAKGASHRVHLFRKKRGSPPYIVLLRTTLLGTLLAALCYYVSQWYRFEVFGFSILPVPGGLFFSEYSKFARYHENVSGESVTLLDAGHEVAIDLRMRRVNW